MIRLLLAILALVLLSDAAAAKLPCLSKDQAMARGDSPSYRKVPGLGRCWYVGERTPKKSEFVPVKKPAKIAKRKVESEVMPNQSLQTNTYGGPPSDKTPPVSATATPGRADQARLERAFNELRTLWATMHMAPWQVHAIYGLPRLEYRREFPAAWAMASRWP